MQKKNLVGLALCKLQNHMERACKQQTEGLSPRNRSCNADYTYTVYVYTVLVFIIYYLPIAPGSPPATFTISASGPRSLTFSWEPPLLPNGVIIGYQLSCSPQRPGFPETFNQSTRVDVTREGFAPDTVYTCSVFASTRAGYGPSVNHTVRTLEARKICLF